jgi:uncharacterized protein (DUF1697 family)
MPLVKILYHCTHTFNLSILINQNNMNTYISLLRGINVSGQKLIKMEALRKMYEELGFTDTKTYIQSGNVVFRYKKAGAAALEKMIADKIAAVFGFEVYVMVKEPAALEEALLGNPFVHKRSEDGNRLYITFLAALPEKKQSDSINPAQYQPDEFIISGKTVYLFCAGGYGNTKLSNNFFESKLKVSATTRNLKTIGELVDMAKAISSLK